MFYFFNFSPRPQHYWLSDFNAFIVGRKKQSNSIAHYNMLKNLFVSSDYIELIDINICVEEKYIVLVRDETFGFLYGLDIFISV